MITEIKTKEDVKAFFEQLIDEGLNFHPDTPFENYINSETREPSYTKDQADIRNILIDQCFDVCENLDIDIYNYANDIYLIGTGLDKYIPLSGDKY